MPSAKKRIRQLVELYEKTNADEFQMFQKAMVAIRASLKDEEFGTVEKSDRRALYEMPETLQVMLIKGLNEDEIVWFKSGVTSNRNQGGQWFAKTFPAYRIPSKV